MLFLGVTYTASCERCGSPGCCSRGPRIQLRACYGGLVDHVESLLRAGIHVGNVGQHLVEVPIEWGYDDLLTAGWTEQPILGGAKSVPICPSCASPGAQGDALDEAGVRSPAGIISSSSGSGSGSAAMGADSARWWLTGLVTTGAAPP